MIRKQLPILCVCGRKSSGKTTLIERAIIRLREAGLDVAAVKHAGEIHLDTAGTDSDRFFRAGAEVLLEGPAESVFRSHDEKAHESPEALACRCDIVLVEGHKSSPYSKVWLEGKEPPLPGLENVIAMLPPGEGRDEAFASIVEKFLDERLAAAPVYGCVLIGGASRRMGEPKHLIKIGGVTLLERTCRVLENSCQKIVIAGSGQIPNSLDVYAQLPDAPEAEGPLAGLLSAMRWAPLASWLVAACDMPDISPEALQWLLGRRAPGRWAIMGKPPGGGRVEPLCAYYDFRLRGHLERHARIGEFKLSALAAHPKTHTAEIPSHLAPAWRNVNTPNQLNR